MSNPETFRCHYCGFVWRFGMHGGHSCNEMIRNRLIPLCNGLNFSSVGMTNDEMLTEITRRVEELRAAGLTR